MKIHEYCSAFVLALFCSSIFAGEFSDYKARLKEVSRMLFDADSLCAQKKYAQAYLKCIEAENKIIEIKTNKVFYNKRSEYIKKQISFFDSITTDDLVAALQEKAGSETDINELRKRQEESQRIQEQQRRQEQARQQQEMQRKQDQMMRQQEQQRRQYEQWRRDEIANAERRRQDEMRREEQRRRQEEQMRRLQQK
jgi:hypothetical protein